MQGPKEDPEDKKARLRERRLSLLEQERAGKKNAQSLSADLRNVYGLRSMSMFGTAGQWGPAAVTAAAPTKTPWGRGK
jgi:hypothetical protein